MLNPIWATVQDGRIELAEAVKLPEGARVLVTLLSDDDASFGSAVSEESLATVWDNSADDVYGQLLAD